MTEIDPELSRLIVVAANKLEALESEAHQAEMAKLRDLDNQRVEIADRVQSRIIEATEAQGAVYNYRTSQRAATELKFPEPPVASIPVRGDFDETELFEPDQFATPRANGAGDFEESTPPAQAD